MARTVNQTTLSLVKEFEGLRLDAYLCPAGVPTIGYGHTEGVHWGQKITAQQAEEFLLDDLREAGNRVEALIRVALNDNQYGALVSFTFNVGAGSLERSTLRRKLNEGDYSCVPTELGKWVYATDPATGVKAPLAGLVRRRAAEGVLWLAPISGMPQRVESHDGVFDGEADAGYTATLTREVSDAEGTLGMLVVTRISSGESLSLRTIELPWANNQVNVSCVPAGKYECEYKYTNKIIAGVRYWYLLNGTAPREGILMHIGNFAGDKASGYRSDSEGCILLGKEAARFTPEHSSKPQKAVTRSAEACSDLANFTGGAGFVLTIS